MVEEALGVAKVADLYNVDPVTVRRWIAQGLLPGAYKVGDRVWAIPRSALKRFVPPSQRGENEERDVES